MLKQGVVPQQKFLPIDFAEYLAFFNSLPEAPVMDEMAARHPPEKCFLFITTSNTFKFFYFDLQLFALNDVPPSVLAEIARKGGGQKLKQPAVMGQLHPDQPIFIVYFLLILPVLEIPPFVLAVVLADEGVPDVLADIETSGAQSHVFAGNALVDRLGRLDFFQLTPITVVIKLLAHFHTLDVFNMLVLLLFQLFKKFGGFFVPAEWALNYPIFIDLVLRPLPEALQMENVHALRLTHCDGISLHDFQLANCTNVFRFFLHVLVFLFNDDPRQPVLRVFEEFGDFVGVNDPASNDIPELFVGIGVFVQNRMSHGQVENLSEHIHGMQAVNWLLGVARTFQIVSNGDLKFHSTHIFQDEACPACDPHQIEFLFPLELCFYTLDMLFLEQLQSLFFFLGFARHIFIFQHWIIKKYNTTHHIKIYYLSQPQLSPSFYFNVYLSNFYFHFTNRNVNSAQVRVEWLFKLNQIKSNRNMQIQPTPELQSKTAFITIQKAILHGYVAKQKTTLTEGLCEIDTMQNGTEGDNDQHYSLKIEQNIETINNSRVFVRIYYPENTTYLFENISGQILSVSFKKDIENLDKFDALFSNFCVILDFNSENISEDLKLKIQEACPPEIETKDVSIDLKEYIKKIGVNVGAIVGAIHSYTEGPTNTMGKMFSQKTQNFTRESIGQQTKAKWNGVVEKSKTVNESLTNMMRPAMNIYNNVADSIGQKFYSSQNSYIKAIRDYSLVLSQSLNEGQKKSRTEPKTQHQKVEIELKMKEGEQESQMQIKQ